MPKVSVIIPTYNRRDYLQEAVTSVLTQTYDDYEVIVVDDGSTDCTGEMLTARFGNQIQYVWQENQGESVARNRGIEMSSGKFIAFLDSDDLWLPDKLAEQVPILDTERNVGMVFCQSWIINKTGHRIDERPFGRDIDVVKLNFETLCFHNKISGPSTTMIRRSVFEKIGLFDPEIRFGEDWDLWLRMAIHYKFDFISRPLVCIRRHQGTQTYYPSSTRNAQRLCDHLTVLTKVFTTYPDCLPTNLQHQAISYQYLQAFLAEEVVGNTSTAKDNLESASRLAPELLKNLDLFGTLIVNSVAIVAEQGGRSSFDQAVDYVKNVLEYVNSVGALEKFFEKNVLASAYSTIAFIAYKTHDIHTARKFFLRAIYHDPILLKDRGVLSILVRSVVGKRVFGAIQERIRLLQSNKIGKGFTQ